MMLFLYKRKVIKRMRKFNWAAAVVVTMMAGVLVACNGIIDKSEKATEVVREPSTRTPNSVIGKWYQYEEWDQNNVYIWEFEEGGKYYFTREENYYKQGEDYIISKDNYTIIEDKILLDFEVHKIEYTDYGLCITDEDGYSTKLYEYRQDALEGNSEYYTSDFYLQTMADENGCVIQDDVLIAYFTNDKNIVIPNVKEISGFVIKSELECIESIFIPGYVDKIGDDAFCETSVDKIYIEDGVKEIGDYAFSDCYFDEIHIPASVEAIGDLAFSYEEANTDGKIYVQAGSYAEEFFKNAHFTGEVIVE